jgi:hypothetical protein
MANSNLTKAKKAKNDEFYTQYFDIEKEVSAYIEFNPNVFKGKTILLPCDDPEWSNFTKFFAQNFTKFGLKKLISTSYATESKSVKSAYTPTLFETSDPRFDKNKTIKNGKIFTLLEDKTGNGKIDVDDLEWEYLNGDGDFRSDEIKKLRDEADIIVTNPPFSLFRDFLSWIMEGNKQFLIIGNLNAITYKEIFPLLKENRVWLGNNYKVNGGAMFYEIPEDIANLDQVREIKVNDNGKKVYITRVQGVRWFTNLEHGRLHQPLPLLPEADVIKFVTKKPFEKYDNYQAIEVSLVKNIPSDYAGVIGVPISFFDKYSPEQFEVIGATESEGRGFSMGLWDESSGTSQPLIKGERVYKRIFIKHKKK